MSETPNPETVTPPAPVATPPVENKPEARFSQDDLNRIGTQQKEEGERAAAKRISDELGMTVEEAKDLIKANQERQDAEKTELERAASELEKVKAAKEKQLSDSEAEKNQIKSEQHADRLMLRLLKAKVPLPEDPAQADEALADLAGFIRVPVGASFDEIDAAIDGLKTKFPALFEATPSDPVPKPSTPSSVPSGKPQKPSVGKTGLEIGAQIAAERMEQRGIRVPS